MTISTALSQAAEQLERVEDGPIIARLLLAHVLNVPVTYVFGYANSSLSDAELSAFEQLISRAANHEPLAYLVGHKEFYGLDFVVTPDVLIPRPATEGLIDTALSYLRNTVLESRNVTIVDVGTGSGCIAMTLAKHLPMAIIYAIDVSEKALEVAKTNAERYAISNATFMLGSLLEPLQGSTDAQSVDIILANLPYISDDEFDNLPRNVKDFEPSIALKSGSDADFFNRQLIQQTEQWLKPGGLLAYETTNGRIEVQTA